MYEAFSADYDRFVDWPARLAVELPFVRRHLELVGARRILDAACGTGMHAISLAAVGYETVGADNAAGMIDLARRNATAAGSAATFRVAGFGPLAEQAGGGFDAVLCLGNSLPHILSSELLAAALADFRACLRPEGLALIQNRNFDAVLAAGNRWMDPQSHTEGAIERVFVRFYDFLDDDVVRFNILTLRKEAGGAWEQHAASTALRALSRLELAKALHEAGFDRITYWGDMQGAPFDIDGSPNLVVTARAPA